MMSTPTTAISSFSARYALECLAGGGVLVDLNNGNYFRLNSTAAMACQALMQTETFSEAARLLEARFGIPTAGASSILSQITREVDLPTIRQPTTLPLRYRADETGYTLDHDGVDLLHLDLPGEQLSTCWHDPRHLPVSLLDCVRAILPKILFLQGLTVLHGSANVLPEGATAFCGISGAGKTTLGRAFHAAGIPSIAEDLVIVSMRGPSPCVYRWGERVVHAWSERAASSLARRPTEPISCRDLHLQIPEEAVRLSALWFIDAHRRIDSDVMQLRVLEPIEGMTTLMANDFLGTAQSGGWRRYVKTARQLVERTTLLEASLPNGLGPLLAAAASYNAISAS
jgi:hypothetical protein